MKRLTKSWEDNGDRYHCLSSCEKECVNDSHSSCFCDPIIKARLKLAKYEDTGLEPEEVAELAQAKDDGRLVVLPCKVGDAVYKLWYEPCHNGEDRPDGMGCAGCIGECDIKRAVVPFTANSVEHIVGMRNSLNRFWFLTREEAEAALKGAEHE